MNNGCIIRCPICGNVFKTNFLECHRIRKDMETCVDGEMVSYYLIGFEVECKKCGSKCNVPCDRSNTVFIALGGD